MNIIKRLFRKHFPKKTIDAVVLFDYYDKKDREIVVVMADDVIAEDYGIKVGDNVKIQIIKEEEK